MSLLLNAQGLSKSYGTDPFFRDIRFVVSEGDRIGLIGPNGSGKSTLLRILAGHVEPDTGEVALRKRTRLSYVAQDSDFPPGATVRSVIEHALERSRTAKEEWEARLVETLGRAGFEDFAQEAAKLSGGWRKRLAIAEALVQESDILLLDEPTNHLDIAGIEWLERLIDSSRFACVVVSHDRYLLENVASEMAELSRVYPDGLLRVSGNYSSFLEKKREFLRAQARHQDALENRVNREIEWLRRGAKARTSKSKARIDKAQELMSELGDLQSRTRTATAAIDFSATDRKTKRLVALEGVGCALGGRELFENLDFPITAGMRVGLVGPNGSGKTTLLRLLRGDIEPDRGTIKRADNLRIVYFDQTRQIDPNITVRRALAPDGDSVIYQGRVIHVAGWAARLLAALASAAWSQRARVLASRSAAGSGTGCWSSIRSRDSTRVRRSWRTLLAPTLKQELSSPGLSEERSRIRSTAQRSSLLRLTVIEIPERSAASATPSSPAISVPLSVSAGSYG